jgi:hypothetical protein
MLLEFLFALTLPLEVSATQPAGWHGLVPLHATCQDAKRTLGISNCTTTTFDLKEAKVSIVFSDGTCASGWKASAGTVVSILVHPKSPLMFSALSLNEARYQRNVDPHLPDVVQYENKDDGVAITVFKDGTVVSLFYGPATVDASLSCRTVNLAEIFGRHNSIKFDEYSEVDSTEENERLSRFALELNAWPSVKGYIVSSGQNRPSENAQRSRRAKEYLVKHGISADRIVCVDGGTTNERLIQLFLVIP